MFLALMNALTVIFLVLVSFVALALLFAGLGALTGNVLVAIRRAWRAVFAR